MDKIINELEKLQQFYFKKQAYDIQKYSSELEEYMPLNEDEMKHEFEVQKNNTLKVIDVEINKIRFATLDEKTKYLLVYLSGLKNKILSISFNSIEELSDEIKKYKSVMQSSLEDKNLSQEIDDYEYLLEKDNDLKFLKPEEEKNVNDKCKIIYDSKSDTYTIREIQSNETMSIARENMPSSKQVSVNNKTQILLIDRNISQLASEFDKNNETCFQEKYIKLLKLGKNRGQVRNVASKLGVDVLYDLTYLYDYNTKTGESLFTPEERKMILSVANFASKKGFAKVKKGFKVLILETVDKIVNRNTGKLMITDGEQQKIKNTQTMELINEEDIKDIENALEDNRLRNTKNKTKKEMTPEEERKEYINKYFENSKRIKDNFRKNSKSYVKKTSTEQYFDNAKEARDRMAQAQRNASRVEWKNGNVVIVKDEAKTVGKAKNEELEKYFESTQRIKDNFKKNSVAYVKKGQIEKYFDDVRETRQKMSEAQKNNAKPQWINGNIVMVKDEEQDERE